VEESGVDEPEHGKPVLDKLVLSKLEVGFDLAEQITVALRLEEITLVGSCSIYILSIANGGWKIREGIRTITSFTARRDDETKWWQMYQGIRKEIQTKGVIGDSIHFDVLGDMQESIKMGHPDHSKMAGIIPPLSGGQELVDHRVLQRSFHSCSKELDQYEIFFEYSSCDSAGHIEAVPAGYDIVPAGHVLVSTDRYRIC
nr:hypothetical protein [Tanacetum cinerariifolium]